MARKKRNNDVQPIGVGLTVKQSKKSKPLDSNYLLDIEPLTDKMVKNFINSQSTIKENIYLRLTNANLNLKSYSNLGLPKQGHFLFFELPNP